MKLSLSIACVFLALACATKNQSQTILPAKDYFIHLDGIRMMELDQLGNLYIVDDSDRLYKFDTTGQKLHMVVNNNLGHVHSIDVGNPFKVMAFYRDQQTIVMYDNTLSEIQRIPIIEWDLHDVTAANLSPDNAIWLFNGENKVLMKMSDKGDPVFMSDPFDIIGPPSARPDFIYDVDQLLLLKEVNKPVAVFDDFGNYKRAIEDAGEFFTVSGNNIIYPAGKEIRLHQLTDQQLNVLQSDESITNRKAYYFKNRLYLYSEKGVYFMTLPNK